jgi:uncharacterized protein (UPF0276 family)
MFKKLDYCLGVGLNYRSEYFDNILKYSDSIDYIEINTERFFQKEKNFQLLNICKKLPLVLHGLTLSIGDQSSDISQDYLNNLSHTLADVNCKWFSEHIAITSTGGIDIRSLMPVEYTKASAECIIQNAKTIMHLTNKPFLLENISYYYNMPTNEVSEIEFINLILREANCGLLLDLNNLYVNSINHGYDPYEFLDQLPHDRIVEIHLAGCDYIFNTLVDTHASSIKKEVLSLFEYVCKRTLINGVTIERDAKLDNFQDLIDEMTIVRSILKKHNML